MAYDMIVDSAKLNGAMKATADAVREKTGDNELINWSMDEGFKGSVEKVFEAGKQAGEGAMWDSLTDFGNRIDFQYGFMYWGADYIRPNRKLVPTNNATRCSTFNRAKIKAIEKKYFDFSQSPKGTSNSQGWYYTFFMCENLEIIEDIGINNAYSFVDTFSDCKKLHTIECIYPDGNTSFSNNVFKNCKSLVKLTVNGTIGQNGFNVKDCTKLDKESHISIVNSYSTTANVSVTFSKVAVDKAFETSAGANDGSTSAEWLALVGTRPNVSILLA